MKKIALVLSILAVLAESSSAQKSQIDTSLFYHWPTVVNESVAISNDGKYALYVINNRPAGGNTLVIQTLKGDRKIEFSGVRKGMFTDDSRYAFFLKPNDSLCRLDLKTFGKAYTPYVRSYKLFLQGRSQWCAYQVKNPENELVVQDLSIRSERTYLNVEGYFQSADGHILVLKCSSGVTDRKRVVLKWVNLFTNDSRIVWEGSDIKDLTIDNSGMQMSFIAQIPDSGGIQNVIWYYHPNQAHTMELANNRSTGIDSDLEIAGISKFSKDGKRLFVNLKHKELRKASSNAVKVDVWSYTDAKLQSQQLLELKSRYYRNYLGAITLSSPGHILRIQQEDDEMSIGDGPQDDRIVIAASRKGEISEFYWNKDAVSTTFLVSTVTGERQKIAMSYASLSPGGKYVIGYGTGGDQYRMFSYDIATGIQKDMTVSLPVRPAEHLATSSEQSPRHLFVQSWLVNDDAVLVCDDHDIFQVDPAGNIPSRNLTKGQDGNMTFRLARRSVTDVIRPDDVLLLQAFNSVTKESGFYRLQLRHIGGSDSLFMGDYLFEGLPDLQNARFPLKARDVNIYLVSRERTDESPNIFYTTDFKKYIPVSNVNPEREVNWFKSELVDFVTPDGVKTQAVLYKPDDFSPEKKYPLLIHYYELESDGKNKFQTPIADDDDGLDIAWFVCHGYLVLITDIHYNVGETGRSVYNSIVGAADYLSKFPWVDKTHIGIQGHSFGGYETTYLITHSNIFAAAVSSCGVSDLTSGYGDLWGGGNSQQEYYETKDRGFRMGTTPWENPDLYVKNSPIFSIGNIKTPVLILANKNDHNVRFAQGVELFTALRRAGKIAWMLQYDNGDHGVIGDDYRDYVLRVTQFFDHYLKGARAPIWMTHGIPASKKGIDDGLELDNEIKTPGPGLSIE